MARGRIFLPFMVAMPRRRFRVCTVQMKLFWLILGLAVTPVFSVSAQVTVSLTLDQDQFLPSESLPVAVHITNQSGQPLHLGADPDWLTFSVEAEDDFIVVKNADPPVQGEFESGFVAGGHQAGGFGAVLRFETAGTLSDHCHGADQGLEHGCYQLAAGIRCD